MCERKLKSGEIQNCKEKKKSSEIQFRQYSSSEIKVTKNVNNCEYSDV